MPYVHWISACSLDRSLALLPPVTVYWSPAGLKVIRTDPRPTVKPAEGRSEFVPLKKSEVGSFTLLHKISRIACCFGIRTLLKQYNCYESATIWYTDYQYLAQYSEIINNMQEIPLMFCYYAACSCGTWRKGPGKSHVMSCGFQI